MEKKSKPKKKDSTVTKSYPFGASYAIPFPYGVLRPQLSFALPYHRPYPFSFIPPPIKIVRKHQIALLKTQAEYFENIAGTIREFISEAEKEDKEKKE